MRMFTKTKSKKIVSRIIAFSIMTCMLLLPVQAFAAQSNDDIDKTVATKAQLTAIVGPQVDTVYSTIKNSVSDYAGSLVKNLIGNKDSIKSVAKPLVSDALKSALQNYNISNATLDSLIDQTVNQVVDNQYVDKVLDNEFVQAILARTVRYATADIIDALHIDADKDAVVQSVTDHIWNAKLQSVGSGTATTKVKSDVTVLASAGIVVNTSYYDFSVTSWNTGFLGIKTTPKEINVTGWNKTTINTYIAANVGISTASKYSSYTNTLAKMDYKTVILNAAKRAVKDEIRERIEALILKIKTEALSKLEGKLAKIDVAVSLDPKDSLEATAKKIEAALKVKAAKDARYTLEQLLNKLCS